MRFRRLIFDVIEYEANVFGAVDERAAELVEQDYLRDDYQGVNLESSIQVIRHQPTFDISDAITLNGKEGLVRILCLDVDSIKDERLRRLVAVAQYTTEQISKMLDGEGSNF